MSALLSTSGSSSRGDSEKFNYRPDIDGLRAIAVLAVIIFHVDKHLLPGGFVGVDIFFVISGFLISRNIWGDIEREKFSLLDFYRRRVKRIAPAMLVVVILTTIAAQFVMIPDDAERVAESALWSVLSLANVYFWLHQDTGYFAAASSDYLLLHLWSLGVEEQFYMLWPLVLSLAYRRPRAKAFFVFAAVTALASFALGEVLSDASFSYFMLPTRAGELLVGALVALSILRRIEITPRVASTMAATGVALIAGSLALISEDATFPGLLAIPPTFGAGLLILAGHRSANPLTSALAFKPLVWVGLVSYSAYLWHWPIIAFFRYGHAHIGFVVGAAIIVLTFVLAWASYRFIETPCRTSRGSVRRVFLTQYIVPAGAIATLALGAMYLDGYGLRWLSPDYRTQLAALSSQTSPAYQFEYVCQRQVITVADTTNDRCLVGGEKIGNPHTVLWGDSHAAHYVGMIGAFAKHANFQFRNFAVSSCPPVFADPASFVSASRVKDCRDSAEPIHSAVMAADIVIISATWSDYVKRSDTFLPSLFATVKTLVDDGKRVILMGKAPEIDGYDRRCREKTLSYPIMECAQITAAPVADVERVNATLEDFARRTPRVSYFDVSPYLCQAGACKAIDQDGAALYYDRAHLSIPGSWALGGAILRESGMPQPFAQMAERLDAAR